MNELIDIKFYSQIKSILESARGQVYKATNAAMVWRIGRSEKTSSSSKAAKKGRITAHA